MPPSPALPLRLLLTGALSFMLIGAVPGLYGLVLPGFSARFGAAGAGWLLAAHGLGSTLAVLAGLFNVGRLSMRASLFCVAAGAAGVAMAPGWGLVLPAALVGGLGFGGLSLVVNRRFLTEFGPRGPGMVGVVNGIYGVGAIIGPYALLAAGEVARPVFLGIAVLGLCLIPLVKPSARSAVPPARGLPKLDLRRATILLFVFCGALIEMGLSGYGPTALLALGMGSQKVAVLSSAFFATFLLGRLSLFWLARHIRPEHCVIAAFFGTAAAMALMLGGLPELGFALAGAAAGLLFPSFFVLCAQVLGEDERLTSLPLIASLAGATLGPLLLAPVLRGVGDTALIGAELAIGALAGTMLLISLPFYARIAAGRLDRSPAA